MKFKYAIACLPLALFAGAANQAAVGDIIVQNSGFESPELVRAGDQFFKAGTDFTAVGWTFSDWTSTSENGMLSELGTTQWGAKVHGKQCAALSTNATVSQELTGFQKGTATVSFYAQAVSTPYQFQVMLGTDVLEFNKTAYVLGDDTMRLYTSDPVAVDAGSRTLQFKAGGWTFLDDVSVSNVATPEPSSIILLTAGMIGLLAYAWRKRK